MSRRAVMTLFSAADEALSHRTRIVLAEKAVDLEVIEVVPGRYPEDLMDLNPHRTLPTLIDRDLVLYESRIIMEYLDERFPHPPLMPVDPMQRAQFRLALFRIESDWYPLAQQLEQNPDGKDADKQRKALRDLIVQSDELFKLKPFFLSDSFSLVDATIAPILWRLPRLQIEVPAQAQAVSRYANQILTRPSVRHSATAAERAMRSA